MQSYKFLAGCPVEKRGYADMVLILAVVCLGGVFLVGFSERDFGRDF